MASVQLNTAVRADAASDHKYHYDLANQLYVTATAQHSAALLDDAFHHASLAHGLRPTYVAGFNLLARIEMQRRRYAEAEQWIEKGLRLKPDSASLLYSAGHIALAQHQLPAAEQYFTQSARISRVATRAVNSLAHVKLLQRDYVEAFRHYRELVKTQARDKQIRSKLFEAAARVEADYYSEELEQDLLRYLDFPDADYSQLRPLATSLLKHKLRLSEAGCPLTLEAIIADPLLLKCLTKFYFCDPVIERLLITLRQSLLFSCSRHLAIRQDELPLVAALAQQVQLNESVWYTTTQEDMLVSQLVILVEKMLSLADVRANDLYPALSLVLMYRPLNQCSFWAALSTRKLQWPDVLEPFIRSLMLEHKQLQRAAQQLTTLAPGSDKTSQAVMQQYDENPYPRWTDIGYNHPANYHASLQAAFPQADLRAIPHNNARVLVAGCGTGRHAIRLAQYFKPLSITALDLSKTALAYASHQAQKRGHGDIQFIQGDLLDIGLLNDTFDVIECSGVLHHMQNPQEGLKALAASLKPGGVMKIALYSRTARERISALRKLLNGHMPTATGDMRLVREALLQKSLPGDWSDIYNSPDFYSLSACRDLLFHTQEHVFDATELEHFAATAGLHMLGMIAPPGYDATAKAASRISMAQWQALEHNNPALFAGMYQFYVQKPLTAAS